MTQRVQAFMWMLCHDAIMSNFDLVQRHITTNAPCSSCQAPIETSLHIVRDCHVARIIWEQLVPIVNHPNFFTQRPQARDLHKHY